MPTWVYEVLVTKDNLDEALEYVRRVEKELDQVIAITPKKPKTAAKA